VEFQAGYGDSSDLLSATWVNGGTRMSASALDTEVAAAALDGCRYVFLRAWSNSNGTDQPTLTSVTFTGQMQ